MQDPSLPPEIVALMNTRGLTLLEAWRTHRGLTIRDVATRLRVMPVSFERWEKGGNPCNSILLQLARIYDCHVAELID